MTLTFASSLSYRFRPFYGAWTRRQQPQLKFHAPNQCRRSMGHTVRIIVTQDVSDGKLYQGDIANVKAGYARNFLIPQKKAIYATRQNFLKLNMKDPELETAEERRLRMEREMKAGDDKDLKAADILRSYLRSKTLKIWRNIDTSTGSDFRTLNPGFVDAKAIRKKLSFQFKIDLQPHEKVHLHKEEVNLDEMKDSQLDEFVNNPEVFGDRDVPCTIQIKSLGQYVARISLKGGFSIPLKFEVVKR